MKLAAQRRSRCAAVAAVAAARGDRRRLAQSRRRRVAARAPTPRARRQRRRQIARGEYLARAGNCVGCHTARGGAPYAGGRGIETPFGTVYAPNLTPDARPASALEQRRFLARAAQRPLARRAAALSRPSRTRTTPASRAPTPTRCSPTCAAWRRSRSRTGRTRCASRSTSRPRSRSGARSSSARRRSSPIRRDSPQWNRGAYLVEALGHCNACHSRRNVSRRDGRPARPRRRPDPGAELVCAVAHATTPKPASADWAEREVVALLKTGVSARGSVHGADGRGRARSTQYLSDADLAAMADLPEGAAGGRPTRAGRPATRRRARRAQRAAPSSTTTHCAACHGEHGEGVAGAYPALAGNRAVDDGAAGQPRPHGAAAAASRRRPPATRARSACRRSRPCSPDARGRRRAARSCARRGATAPPPVSTLEVSRYRGARDGAPRRRASIRTGCRRPCR